MLNRSERQDVIKVDYILHHFYLRYSSKQYDIVPQKTCH